MNKFLRYLTVLLIFLIPMAISAQGIVEISGKQIRGNISRNAQLYSDSVVLSKRMKVISVSGNNRGFWISSEEDGIIASFYEANDKKVIGLVLKKGTYYIYPNLSQKQNSASVTIKLK